MNSLGSFIVTSGLLLSVFFPSSARCEETLPVYEPVPLKAESLTSVGSDSMDELVSLWVQTYKKYQPHVTIEVKSQGSASAPPALIEGSADFGPMVRPMTTPELEDFELKYGFKPTQIKTALVGLSVYVSKANPLNKISLKELDAIFSKNRERGASSQLTQWSQLGTGGEFGNNAIIPIGRPHNSYLTAYFRQRVLLQGDFLPEVASTADMNSMLQTIATNPGAIGFGDMNVSGEGIKTLAVSENLEDKAFTPNLMTMLKEQYPLARFLSVYIVRFPGKALDEPTKDFLKFVLSHEGQKIVETQGFVPLPANVVNEERQKLL